jgi:hypothetical protein
LDSLPTDTTVLILIVRVRWPLIIDPHNIVLVPQERFGPFDYLCWLF